MNMHRMKWSCCMCGNKMRVFRRLQDNKKMWGNNAEPVVKKGRCCDECATNIVLPYRMQNMGWRPTIKIDVNDPNVKCVGHLPRMESN